VLLIKLVSIFYCSSEDELVDDADTENVVNKLNPEMDAKLAKLKAQLHSIKNLSDNEAEEEDNRYSNIITFSNSLNPDIQPFYYFPKVSCI
jgi:hypothetical protein